MVGVPRIRVVMMLKSKQGKPVYWLVGAASVVLATWQFAMLVTY